MTVLVRAAKGRPAVSEGLLRPTSRLQGGYHPRVSFHASEGIAVIAFQERGRHATNLELFLDLVFVFAVIIGTVSCHQGLITIGGPRGIGRSVTKAVVNAIVLILILDYFVTRLLLSFEK